MQRLDCLAPWFACVTEIQHHFPTSHFADGLRHLTTKAMEEFNKKHPPVGSIPSFSYAGNMQGRRSAFSLLHDIISRREGANDGLVTVASARWED